MRQALTFGLPHVSRSISDRGGRAFATLLASFMGMPVQVHVARSYSDLADRLVEGRLDFAWLPPMDAWQLIRHTGVDPLLQAVRAGTGHYYSALFVPEASPVRSLPDLRGRRIAYVHRSSASGYLVAAARLRSLGIRPAEPALFVGSHEAVVNLVAQGGAEAGATFASLPEGVAEDRRLLSLVDTGWQSIAMERPCAMRALEAWGPIPTDLVCAWPGTSRQVRRDLVGAFEAMMADGLGPDLLQDVFGTRRFARADLGAIRTLEWSLEQLTHPEGPPC